MNQPLSHHLLTMAYQNAWANHRLGKAWEILTPSELAAPRVSFFPSLKATLNHILTCDWFYVDALSESCAASRHGSTVMCFSMTKNLSTRPPTCGANRRW